MQERKKSLGLAILEQMSEKTLSLADYTVKKCERISFRTTLEEAKELGATKQEEVLDKTVLKRMVELGQEVPGTSRTQFIQVIQKVHKEKLD